jgi:hypothetical protein
MFTAQFWIATAERAVKTLAQTALSFFVIGTTGLLELDWVALGSVSGAAAVASVLMSVASAGVNGSGPSVAGEELRPEGGRHL